MVVVRPQRPKRPLGQALLQHDWRWAPQPTRLPWGFLATTGPGEQSYVPGNGTVDGSAYECTRCGCCRLFTYLARLDDDGREHRESVAMHGFDWDSLAPMNAPGCEVWERPPPAPAQRRRALRPAAGRVEQQRATGRLRARRAAGVVEPRGGGRSERVSAEQVDVPLCPEADPVRPSLVGPLVAASDCDGCPLAEARYLDTGDAQVCCCGRVYADEDFTWPAERPSCVVDLAPPVRELAVAIADLRTLRQWAHEERERTRVPLRRDVSPIGRMMGEAGGAQADATDKQVQSLADLIFNPSSRIGRRRRAVFIQELLRYCDETSRPLDEDPVAAEVGRALAGRLAALPCDEARVLRVLGRRCGPSTSWEEAVAVVVDELLPRPVVQVFRAPGRPRVDRTSVPPEVQREAEGEARLADAVRAWCGG